MTLVKIWSLQQIGLDAVLNFAIDNNISIKPHNQGVGILSFSTVPDLTAGQKTALQKMIDAVGYGTIN